MCPAQLSCIASLHNNLWLGTTSAAAAAASAAAAAAGMAFLMLLVIVVVAVHAGRNQLSLQVSLHCLITASLSAGNYLDSCLIESCLSSAAKTSADQYIDRLSR